MDKESKIMRTIASIYLVLMIGLASSQVAVAGKNKPAAGKGKAAGAAGGGGAMGKSVGHTNGGGGGGMNAMSQHGAKGQSQRGVTVHGQGNTQHNATAHGLKSMNHSNTASGVKVNAHQNANFGRNANFKGNANHFANQHFANHWRSGMHWRNSHALYAGYHRVWHDRGWWRGHYNRVLFVNGPYWGGNWYWDGGYWFPAWGYDPGFVGYLYDGPIYAYNNLPPDQVVVNVQEQLQDQGYYTGEIDGQLGSKTRDALSAYQRDHNLEVTAAVDEPTVQALGLA
jgi:hypothetical protein